MIFIKSIHKDIMTIKIYNLRVIINKKLNIKRLNIYLRPRKNDGTVTKD